MSELSHLKQLCSYMNQVFPGGALFLIASDNEFKRLFMELTSSVLQNDGCRKATAARIVGRNSSPPHASEWVFNPQVHIDTHGNLVALDESNFLWLETPSNTNALANSQLACTIKTPLDRGEALNTMCAAIEAFMPENTTSVLATMAACMMASTYQDIVSCCGCSGVPLLYGEPGSCKSEALRCGLALFGAQSTHLYNSQTTPSHLFDVLKQTTIPIAIDDISEKAQDTWEELIIDAYNNTPRGTRSYSCEIFCTLPVISANWRYSSSRSRAFTRVIQIPFVEHSDEPNASTLYSALSNARSNASASVGKIIDICSGFSTPSVQTSLNDDIFPKVSALFSSSHVRFKTTYTVFMHFFLKVSKSLVCICCHAKFKHYL